MSSERELVNLQAQVSDFENSWESAKLKNKALIKKGVLNYKDSEEYEDLRVERCVFYKPAKKVLRDLRMVVYYKAAALREVKGYVGTPVRESRLEEILLVSQDIRKENMGQFLFALRELESEGQVTITREPGMSNSVAAEIISEMFSERYPNTPISRTSYKIAPGHGYSDCVCGGCTVTTK